MGFVFQFYNLIPSLTARENVALVTEIAKKPLAPEEALKLVGLEERLDHFPSQMSGGEQQRVAIARAVEPSAFTKVSALGVEEQRVNVIIDFVDPFEKRESLGDAYRVEARIVVWENQDVPQVPIGALFRRGDQWAVFVIQEGQAQIRPVRIGQRSDLAAEVLEGLQLDQQVILHPSDKIDEGVAVVVEH